MALTLDGTTGITSDGGTPVIENLNTTATGIDITGQLTTTGSVGVGVTPSGWNGSYKAIQFSSTGSVYGASGDVYLGNNVFVNSADSNTYITSNSATMYRQVSGQHLFYTAPSGTAGNAITFTGKARIDSDGLKFNGDTSADNALDDYEEGTWTPTIESSSGTITSYIVGNAKYTKIGRVVVLDFTVSITNAGTAGGVMKVTSLPFSTAVNQAAGVMSENQSVGSSGSLVASSSSLLYGKRYDGGNPVVTNYTWICQITYETT